MSRKCQICGRGPIVSATRSHSNIQSKKISFVNLQKKTVNGKRMRICAQCVKTLAKSSK